MPEREWFPGASQHDLRMEAQANAASGSADQGDGLDSLTKDQLLEEAEARGVEVKTSSTKDEILKALRG